MEFEKVVNGLVKYVTARIIPTMNDWQSVGARILLARALRSSREIKDALINNYYVKTFGFISEDGNVDIDGILNDLRSVFKEQPYIEINIPMYGSLKFTEADIDDIKGYLEG